MSKVLLISVKPEFAEKIFAGTKEIELRKCAPNVSSGDLVIIYSTLPVKAVLGTCIISKVIKKTPAQLWKEYSRKAGIDRKRYFEYFRDSHIAIGIVLKGIQRFQNEISLAQIKKDYPKFSPPQTYRYLPKGQFDRVYRKYVE